MKYIIFEKKYAILFPENIIHSDMASLFRSTPTSAGHYSPEKGVYDRSETLNLESKPEDTEIIKKLLSNES